jgi:CubicO group peptidase (beta-lactamase class C family)
MTFGQITDFGLGVMLDSHGYGTAKPPYGFGTTSSRNTFGHGGACSSIAFADPAKDLAVALCLTGQVPENKHQPRMLALLDLLRSDLA